MTRFNDLLRIEREWTGLFLYSAKSTVCTGIKVGTQHSTAEQIAGGSVGNKARAVSFWPPASVINRFLMHTHMPTHLPTTPNTQTYTYKHAHTPPPTPQRNTYKLLINFISCLLMPCTVQISLAYQRDQMKGDWNADCLRPSQTRVCTQKVRLPTSCRQFCYSDVLPMTAPALAVGGDLSEQMTADVC